MTAGRFDDHHLSTEITEHFPAHQPSLAGQVEHAVRGEEVVFVTVSVHMLAPSAFSPRRLGEGEKGKRANGEKGSWQSAPFTLFAFLPFPPSQSSRHRQPAAHR